MPADWGLEITLPAGVEYTDNLFLTTTDEQEDTILRIRPEFELIGESDKNLIGLGIGVQLERFKSEEALDRNDPFVSLSWDHFLERSTFGLTILGEEESTRITELADTGFVDVFGTRRSVDVAPYWSGTLDDRNSLILTGTYLDVSYDVPSLIDYRDTSLDIGYIYQWNSITTLRMNAVGSRYIADSIGADYDYGEVTFGVGYQANAQLSYDISAGVGYILREVGENAANWLVNASLLAVREYDTIDLAFTSELIPSGVGDVRQRHMLELGYVRALSAHLNFTLDAEATYSHAVGDIESDWNDYFSFQPGFNYRLLEVLALEGWYRYISTQNVAGNNPIENSIYIGIRYEPQRLSLR